MAVRFRDTETGEILAADTPDLASEAEADPSLERLLNNPAFFRNQSTGEYFEADSKPALEEAQSNADLKRVFGEEYQKAQQLSIKAAGRAAQAESMLEFARERPFAAGAAAFAQQASDWLSLGTTKPLMSALGVSREEQEMLAAASPLSAAAGAITGAIVPFALGGGPATALARAGATEAAAAGASRVGQALAAVRGAFSGTKTLAGAATLPVSAPLRVPAAVQAGVEALVPGAAGKIAGGALAAPAASLVYAAPRFIESQIDGREFAGESLVSDMKLGALLGGGLTAIPVAARAAAQSKYSQGLISKMGRTRAERLYRMHAPDIAGKTQAQKGAVAPVELANEAMDAGLVGPFMSPTKMFERSTAAVEEAGERLGEIARMADDISGPINVSKMWDRMVDDVVAEQSRVGGIQPERTARYLLDTIESYRNRLGDNLTFQQLWDVQKQISREVYGLNTTQMLDPSRTVTANALRQFRHIINDELGTRAAEAGIPKGLWQAAKRQYEVASHAERIATKSLKRMARPGMDSFDALATIGSVGVGALAGPAAGIESKLALSTLKYLTPRAIDRVQGAIIRAGKSTVPKMMADDVSALLRQQAQTAAQAETGIAVRPETDAVQEYMNLYADLLEAQAKPMPGSYLSRVEKARKRLERGYLDAQRAGTTEAILPKGYRVIGEMPTGEVTYDVDAFGDALEEARNILAQASVPTTRAVPTHKTESIVRAQREGFEVMRDLRDRFTAQLGRPDAIWGAKRAERSAEELRRLQQTYSDPAVVSQLQLLSEQTNAARKAVADKGSRLMGFVVPVTQLKSHRDKRRQLQSFVDGVQQSVAEREAAEALERQYQEEAAR
jgi:hypothetical protein